MRMAFALLCLSVAAEALEGQTWAPNTPLGSLVVNGVDGGPPAAPNRPEVTVPGPLQVTASGNPGRPFILAWAPGLQPSALVAPPEQVDIGPIGALRFLLDGTSPGLLNLFANTGPTGSTTLSFSLPMTLPAGSAGALQVAVLDPAAPIGLKISAAAEVRIRRPFDFGTLMFGRGPSSAELALFERAAGSIQNTPVTFPIPAFQIPGCTIARRRFYDGTGSLNGEFDRWLAPTPDHPRIARAGAFFTHVRTHLGDLYRFGPPQGAVPSGYFLVSGTDITVLPTPAPTPANWDTLVAIHGASNTLAARMRGGNFNDALWFIRMDGTTFPGGQSAVDMTPVGSPVRVLNASFRIVNDVLYFLMASAEAAPSGILYRAPLSGTQPATAVAVPALGTGAAVTDVDVDLYLAPSGDRLFFRGFAGGASDIYCVSGISPAGESVTNVSHFPASTAILPLGNDYDGTDGRIGASPSGSQVAFAVGTAATHDLVVAASSGAGMPRTLTDDPRFAPAIDTIVDICFHGEDDILFFAGTSGSATDLYDVRLGSGAVINVTATNGQSGAVLPVAATPVALVDPAGYFLRPGRMIFARDGQRMVPGIGLRDVYNLVGVNLATLTPYNITGEEFPGPSTPDCNSRPGLVEVPAGGLMWFDAALRTTTDEELWIVDPDSGAPAMQMTANLSNSGVSYEGFRPLAAGTACAGTRRAFTGAPDQVFHCTSGGVESIVTSFSSGVVRYGSVRFVPAASPQNGLAFIHSPTGNVGSSTLWSLDLGAAALTEIETLAADYWIFGSSGP